MLPRHPRMAVERLVNLLPIFPKPALSLQALNQR